MIDVYVAGLVDLVWVALRRLTLVVWVVNLGCSGGVLVFWV